MKSYILVVDDEPDIRELVKDILEDEGYRVKMAENGNSARDMVIEQVPELILLDIWMPDLDGISLLKEFSQMGISAPVIMITGHGTVETAVEATRLGAIDFIEKPLSLGKLLLTVQSALASDKFSGELHASNRSRFYHNDEPVGKSVIMRNLTDQAKRVASYNTCVLLQGEAGVGKTFFAHYIHNNCQRKEGPFVQVRAASLMNEDIDLLIFGLESNGETSPGLLEQANFGTLFINEIAELNLSTQSKLLDVLITNSFKRSGGMERKEINVRIIAATKYNLSYLAKEGRFRDDLLYRINEITLQIPTLYSHREDIPDLLHYFTDLFVTQDNVPYRKISFAAQNWLRNYKWPGNIQQLRNLVKQMLILGNLDEITVNEVESVLQSHGKNDASSDNGDYSLPLRQARDQFEKNYLEYHLLHSGGNVGIVAKQVGMERTHLYRKFRALGIDPKKLHK